MTVEINGCSEQDAPYCLRDVALLIEEGYTNGILDDGTTWSISKE